MGRVTTTKTWCDRCEVDGANISLKEAITQIDIAGHVRYFGKGEYCPKCVQELAIAANEALAKVYGVEVDRFK